MIKVTFGFVNCNRLYYLKSCLESFLLCTEDYENKQIIVIDNASSEPGTHEYLEELSKRGFLVIRRSQRDPSNEFATALNTIAENATGKYVAAITGDLQFVVRGGWLREYVQLFEDYEQTTGCISFDAQRQIRNAAGTYSNAIGPSDDGFRFLYHYNRNPIMGAMNCLVSKKMLDLMYPWDTNNGSHEGGNDSETKMLQKLNEIIKNKNMSLFYCAPIVPVAIGIFNEKGGNARVRGHFRYGDYQSPPGDKLGIEYYKIHDFEEVTEKYEDLEMPVSIEEISEAIGWRLPKDPSGAWIKLKDDPNAPGVKV